jgi:hypothetical protein
MQIAGDDVPGLTTSSGATISYQSAVDAIAALRNSVDGFNSTTSQENDLETSASGPLLFASDSNAIAYTRTPSQVRQSHLVIWCQHML